MFSAHGVRKAETFKFQHLKHRLTIRLSNFWFPLHYEWSIYIYYYWVRHAYGPARNRVLSYIYFNARSISNKFQEVVVGFAIHNKAAYCDHFGNVFIHFNAWLSALYKKEAVKYFDVIVKLERWIEEMV